MKNSAQLNTKPTIESTPNSGSAISRDLSYGTSTSLTGTNLGIDDFDPALELKRLRQELIERLLIIQRKAALNAQSDNQKQLAVTIIQKPIQSSPITHPKITITNRTAAANTNEQNLTKTNNKEINAKNDIRPAAALMPDLLDSPEHSAERIMANIESARICISKLQVPNINQPQLKLVAEKLNRQQNYTTTNRHTDNLQPQSEIITQNNEQQTQHHTNKTENNFNLNINSGLLTPQNPPVAPIQQSHLSKPDVVNEPAGIILLQKLNVGLSLVGVVGILFGVFYLFNGGAGNFQPGIPVLFVGLVLIVAGLMGHLLQEYVNSNCPINHSTTNT
ncbi:MAG: hypothetical protein LBT09_12780 [Planctomycetaceae bacterium]|jgi:hypothetical protein|nr:hypothetical protein [Planctomycetaceae bacterium]